MLTWDDRWTNLRDVLAGTYWKKDKIQEIIVTAQLRPWQIADSPIPTTYWTNILLEARLQNQVPQLLAVVRKEYPQVAAFNMEVDDLLKAMPVPDLPAGAWQGPVEGEKLEAIIGAITTLRDINFLSIGIEKAKSVARIVLADGSRGTGFLVGDNYLVTNNHVLPNETVAATATAEFNVQKTVEGRDDRIDPYPLAPNRFWKTSQKEDAGGDDWTVVAVDGNPRANHGYLNLVRAEPKAKDEVIIVQHPSGGPKKIALSHNVVAYVDAKRVQYLTDTEEGSSGSPVFDSEWRIVALHHKGGLLREPGSATLYKRNQGIHVNVLVDALQGTEVLAPVDPA